MPCAVVADRGSSNWRVVENHFFQQGDAQPIATGGAYTHQGVCINAGTDHLVEGNFIGGSVVGAGGDRLRTATTGAIGSYASLVPFRIDAPEGLVNLVGNTVRNIEVSGTPFIMCDALALGSLAIAGEVNFIENTFGDPVSSTTEQLVVRTNGTGNVRQGGYRVVPIHYKAETGKQATGRVVRNKIGSVLLEGSFSGSGIADMAFIGILSNPTAVISEISDNTIANIHSRITGNIGISITGIHSLGLGNTAIARNVLYHFYNTATVNSLGCVSASAIQDPDVSGIVIENQPIADAEQAGDVLVANNMISFQSLPEMASSSAVYQGILVPSNMFRTVKVFHNTVFIGGSDNQAQGRNFVFYRRGTAPTLVRNNIFLNTRQTNTPNFIIGSSSGGLDSDYNLIFQKSGSSFRDFGFYGPGGVPDDSNDASRFADSCEEWKTISGQDQNSLCVNMEDFFVDPQAGNLRILQTLDNPVVDAGIAVAEVVTDIDLLLRVEPDMGASEAFNAWIGVVSTDWFDARNWSTGRVPGCQEFNLLLILPPGATLPKHTVNNREVERVIYQPVIVPTATSPAAIYRNLLVQEGATVTIGSPDAHLFQCSEKKPLHEGIQNFGTIAYTQAGGITLNGVLNNEGTITAPTGRFVLGGAERQNINSSTTPSFWELHIEGGGRKVVRTPVLVKNVFHLADGIYQGFRTNSLTLDVDARVTGTPTNTAHVDGRMVKRFKAPGQEFLYPVGDAGRLGLMAIQTSADGVQQYPASFAVEYFVRSTENSGDLPPTDLLHEDVDYISEIEVWQVNSLDGGEANARIGLYYHAESGIEPVEDAEVVRWEETTPGPGWTMAGESELQENIPEGYGYRLLSDPMEEFTFFTLGIRQAGAGLPVELIRFEAQLVGQDVQLNWETGMEKNSSHFNVQRSMDGSSFQTIGRVAAAGNSLEHIRYAYKDAGVGEALAGILYYRLEQVDIDGSTDYSPVVAMQLPDKAFKINSVSPNPFTDKVALKTVGDKAQAVIVRLLSLDGRQVYSQREVVQAGENVITIRKMLQLQPGMYLLEVRTAEIYRQFKLIKK